MALYTLEDLDAYQLARQTKLAVYERLSRAPAYADFGYLAQLRLAISSVEANIAEGFHRQGRRDFARFLAIARGSLAEVEVRLRDGVDRHYFSAAEVADLDTLIKRTGQTIMGLRRRLLADSAKR